MPFGEISAKEANDNAINAAGQATPEQIEAIRKWAAKYGRNWKSRLREAWMDGNYDGFEESNHLQRLRNTVGPRWLTRFVLLKQGFHVIQNPALVADFDKAMGADGTLVPPTIGAK